MSYIPNGFKLLGHMKTANFNSTSDQIINLNSSKYIVRHILVTNASVSLTLAAGGIYTAVSKGGSTIVSAAQLYTALTGTSKYLDLTLDTLPVGDVLINASLYFSLTVAQGVAATADIYIFGEDLK